jgi:hypothetical protein
VTIDDLGRSAATAARHKAAQEVEPAMMLRQLHRTHRTRNMLAVGSAVAVAALAAVLVVRGVLPSGGATSPGGTVPTGAPTATCPDGVTCLGGDRYRVDLPVPLTIAVPTNFQGAFNRIGTDAVEDYRSDVDGSGITIMENAQGMLDDRTGRPDPSAGTTATSMATWFTKRPFLVRPTMQATTVNGRHAWLVTGGVKAGVPLLVTKAGALAAPVFRDSIATTAVGPYLHGFYVLVDTPGAGVTVIWVWTTGPVADVNLDSTNYLDGLTFG